MGKKLKRDFKERQTVKEEAKILEKENVSTNESSRLKHGDDYRGKIIHDKDRFQDKIHEKTSKINVENDHIQGVFKRNARYTKGAYENQNTAINDKSRYEAHDDFMSSKDSKGFKEVNNHSSSAEISEKDKNPAFDKKSELQKIKMAGKVRNTLSQPMMWKIIFIQEIKQVRILLKGIRLRKSSIRGKTTQISYTQEI